jgi:selenoprotein W-related protein
MSSKPRISIRYCPRCNWLLRSAWLAQELLTTFAEDLSEVALKPADKGGTFEITLDNTVIWDRSQEGGFPEAKVLKQRVRDCVAPDRTLGHIDR